MDDLILKVTPLTVLPDIEQAVDQYLNMGFERVAGCAPGLVGLRAGKTYLLVATVQLMEGDFPPEAVAVMAGKTIPYIYVAALDAVKAKLSPSAIVIAQVAARGGTNEALVEHNGQYMILAEKFPEA